MDCGSAESTHSGGIRPISENGRSIAVAGTVQHTYRGMETVLTKGACANSSPTIRLAAFAVGVSLAQLLMKKSESTKKALDASPQTPEDLAEEEAGSAEEEEDELAWLDPEVAQTVRESRGYLDEFYEDLLKSGLKDSTISRHMSNADLFLVEWLGMHEGYSMVEGLDEMDDFLGNWYIRRCMWSTPGNIKTTAASLKKFYKSMMDRGHISQADYKELLNTIQEEMPQWQYRCELYNDPNTEWEDIAGEFGYGIW